MYEGLRPRGAQNENGLQGIASIILVAPPTNSGATPRPTRPPEWDVDPNMRVKWSSCAFV